MIQVWLAAPALAVRLGLRLLLEADAQIVLRGESASLGELDGLPEETDVLVAASQAAAPAELEGLLKAAGGAALLLLAPDQASAAPLLRVLHAAGSRQPRAWGILPLECSAEELLAAVHAVYEGLLVGSPAFFEALLREGALPIASEEALIEALTAREHEVLQLLAQGLANKQIAAALEISEHTVKFHVSAIFARLGAASRTEAVRLGVRQGLITL